jgi:hypothetical protein
MSREPEASGWGRKRTGGLALWDEISSHRFGRETARSGGCNLRRDRGRRPPATTVSTTVRAMAARACILARFRRPRAGDRGLIAAPWTPLASLCLLFGTS